jgi:agmatine deiminase
MSKADIEAALRRTLGIKEFIWFKGIEGKDIVDGHTNGLARSVAPGVVLLSRPAAGTPEEWLETYNNAERVLQTSTNAQGRHFEIHEIGEAAEMDFAEQDNDDEDAPARNYVNYLVVNGDVIIPRFEDKRTDDAAKATIKGLFPDQVVVQADLRWIAAGDGGIHCATQQVPLI